MGNNASSNAGSGGGGQNVGFIPKKPGTYQNPYYGTPYVPNTLPLPPKEALPAPPAMTPQQRLDQLHGRYYPRDDRGSNGKRSSLLRGFTFSGGGPSKKTNDRPGHDRSKSDHPYTYPDGTPFPKNKLELSPHVRRQPLSRSYSYDESVYGSKKKKRKDKEKEAWAGWSDNQWWGEQNAGWGTEGGWDKSNNNKGWGENAGWPTEESQYQNYNYWRPSDEREPSRKHKKQQQRPPSWRDRLGIPNTFLRPSEDEDQRRGPDGLMPFMSGGGGAGGSGRSRGRRHSHSSVADIWKHGVKNDSYVPVYATDRTWTLPDGTPYPTPGGAGGNGNGETAADLRANGAAAAGVITADSPEGSAVHPLHPLAHASGQAASNSGRPRSSSGPVFPTPRSPIDGSGGMHFPSNPMPTPPRPYTQSPLTNGHHRDSSAAAAAVISASNHGHRNSIIGGGGVASRLPPDPIIQDLGDGNRTFCFDRKHGFSIYSYHAVKYKGKLYPSACHLWEAMKYIDAHPEIARQIRKCVRTKDAVQKTAEIGVNGVREDWAHVALDKMHEVLTLKFQQHPALLKELLETGTKGLVFLSRREPYWGWESGGQNYLGKLLQIVREHFVQQAVRAVQSA